MLLFAVPWGPQGIYAKKDLNTVEDMKGLKWRAYNVGTSRIAELVGAQPVTIQAAELPQALATGVVNAFMTSGSTGYDSKAWETMTHFYDTQAWIPKNVTFVNKAAFDALDKPTQDAILKAAAVAEERGWKLAEEKAEVVSRTAQGQQDEGAAAACGAEGRPREDRRAADRRLVEEGRRRRRGRDRRLQEVRRSLSCSGGSGVRSPDFARRVTREVWRNRKFRDANSSGEPVQRSGSPVLTFQHILQYSAAKKKQM